MLVQNMLESKNFFSIVAENDGSSLTSSSAEVLQLKSLIEKTDKKFIKATEVFSFGYNQLCILFRF